MANFSYVSLENAQKRLHARQGSPSTRGTLSSCPGHLARRDSFLQCDRFVPGHPPASRVEINRENMAA